jgi:predicted transcriptional regulator
MELHAIADRPVSPPRFSQGRLLVRLLSEMQTSCAVAGQRVFEGELDRSIIFMVIARESGLLSSCSDGVARWDGAGPRAISINALAASLSRPFETVLRHVNALIAQGLCVRTPAGVMKPAEVHERPAIAALFRVHHDALARLAEDMVAFDITRPETRPHFAYDWHTGLAAAHDILLSGIEFYSAQYPHWIDMALVGTGICANARPFTYDREIARSYADFTRLVPERLRAPVPASLVARVLTLPASTAQRRVNAMIAAGVLIRKPGGGC